MHFVPLAFDTSCVLPDHAALPDSTPNRFYAYGVVARLALLAAALELERHITVFSHQTLEALQS